VATSEIQSLHHLTGTPEDFQGNGHIGRYVFLTGSPERARRIGNAFKSLEIKPHPRGHDLFLGMIEGMHGDIAVAAISTGIGCPSTDNIVNELYLLGAKRFLRVGTAGSLQSTAIKTGDVVVATAAVRDEHTSRCYVNIDYPAVASYEMLSCIQEAAQQSSFSPHVHFGIVHTKDSFYAREVGSSDLEENATYMRNLKKAGVMASEMETSHIFILSSIFNYRTTKAYQHPNHKILAGSILAIVGDEKPIDSSDNASLAIDRCITLAIESIQRLAASEILYDN
jgi:uridine phosphorylase